MSALTIPMIDSAATCNTPGAQPRRSDDAVVLYQIVTAEGADLGVFSVLVAEDGVASLTWRARAATRRVRGTAEVVLLVLDPQWHPLVAIDGTEYRVVEGPGFYPALTPVA